MRASPATRWSPARRTCASMPAPCWRPRTGLPLGTLCVLDREPRPEGLTQQQGFALQVLARQVMSQLELRRALKAREADAAAIAEFERQFRILADSMPQMVWATLPDGFHDYYNERWYEFTGVPARLDRRRRLERHVPPRGPGARLGALAALAWRPASPTRSSTACATHDGDYRWTLGRACRCATRGPDRALVRHLHRYRRAEAGRGTAAAERGAAAAGAERRRDGRHLGLGRRRPTGSPPIPAMRGCSP